MFDTCRYFYGREVTGAALVMFGVLTKDNVKTSLPESLRRVEVSTVEIFRKHRPSKAKSKIVNGGEFLIWP